MTLKDYIEKDKKADIVEEMYSIKKFLTDFYEVKDVLLENAPEKPAPETFLIQFQNDNRERLSPQIILTNREYRVIYFEERADNLLEVMDGLSRLFLYGRLVIPIKETVENKPLRYIRIQNFTFGEVFRTQNENIKGCIGILSTRIHEARDREVYYKIMEVYTSYKNNN